MARKSQKGHPGYYKGKYDKMDRAVMEEAVMTAINEGWTPKARKAGAKKCGLAEATFVKYATRCAEEILAAKFGSFENAKNVAMQQINGSESEIEQDQEKQREEPIIEKPIVKSKEIKVNVNDIYKRYGLKVD